MKLSVIYEIYMNMSRPQSWLFVKNCVYDMSPLGRLPSPFSFVVLPVAGILGHQHLNCPKVANVPLFRQAHGAFNDGLCAFSTPSVTLSRAARCAQCTLSRAQLIL